MHNIDLPYKEHSLDLGCRDLSLGSNFQLDLAEKGLPVRTPS